MTTTVNYVFQNNQVRICKSILSFFKADTVLCYILLILVLIPLEKLPTCHVRGYSKLQGILAKCNMGTLSRQLRRYHLKGRRRSIPAKLCLIRPYSNWQVD